MIIPRLFAVVLFFVIWFWARWYEPLTIDDNNTINEGLFCFRFFFRFGFLLLWLTSQHTHFNVPRVLQKARKFVNKYNFYFFRENYIIIYIYCLRAVQQMLTEFGCLLCLVVYSPNLFFCVSLLPTYEFQIIFSGRFVICFCRCCWCCARQT